MQKKKIAKKIPISDRLISEALAEDCPWGDVTTEATVPKDAQCKAKLVAKSRLIVCGLDLFAEVFKKLDPNIKIRRHIKDGQTAKKGDVIATITGQARAILTAERVALNFMQRLSGVATLTAEFVRKTKGTNCKILDTRKTTPLLRDLEKYAVRVGGGKNHRRDLSEMALIKENHIATAGGILAAVEATRRAGQKFVEVEVTNFRELTEALDAGADRLLLDNMTPAQIKKAVAKVAGRAETEASGNMNLKTVGAYAKTGVDYISVGALTHSVPAADLSLLIETGK